MKNDLVEITMSNAEEEASEEMVGNQAAPGNREKILTEIVRAPMGLTVEELTHETGLISTTLSKLLEDLRLEGLVDYRGLGKLKLWFASKSLKKMWQPLLDKLLLEKIISGSFDELKDHLTSDDVGVISLMDTRYALAEGGMVTKLVELCFNLLSYEEAAKALYDLGRGLGRDYMKFWKNRFNSLSREFLRMCPRKLTLYLDSISLLGWGRPELLEYKPNKGKCMIVIHNHLISAPMQGKPIHFLDAGIFSEILSYIIGKRVRMFETKCIGAGDKYCEFRSEFEK